MEITQRRHRKLEKEKKITRASSPSRVLTSSKINVPSGVTQWNDLSGFEQQVTILNGWKKKSVGKKTATHDRRRIDIARLFIIFLRRLQLTELHCFPKVLIFS